MYIMKTFALTHRKLKKYICHKHRLLLLDKFSTSKPTQQNLMDVQRYTNTPVHTKQCEKKTNNRSPFIRKELKF